MGTSQTRYTAEFRAEALTQVVERGVIRHAKWRCVWAYRRGDPAAEVGAASRDRGTRHPKKGHRVLRQAFHVRCAFIREQQVQHAVRTLCRTMVLHPSGYHA